MERVTKDIAEVWETMSRMQAQLAAQSVLLAEIKGMLGERCSASAHRITSLELELKDVKADVDAVKSSMHDIDKQVVKWSVITGLIASAATSSVTGLIVYYLTQA